MGRKRIIMKGIQKYSFGLLGMAAFLTLAFTCSGCIKKQKTASMENTPITVNSDTKTLLALGDSYTIGESVAETDRFPNQTLKLLIENGFKFNYPATIIARTGWTTQNLLDAMAASDAATHVPYGAVTLLIGVNNQFQGRDTAEYRQQFFTCLQKAIYFSGNQPEHVFVVSIPDWGVTPFGASYGAAQVATAIDRFNTINKELTAQMGVSYTNITPVSRQNDPTLVAGDGLHPSGKQYGLWAQMLAAVMEKQLK